ncbi:MAG TPA: C25 family cysteine peptidase [Planctomycetota bacterium]|nr:C25 family cysteine peptidase [Planctomycetota bacterium]
MTKLKVSLIAFVFIVSSISLAAEPAPKTFIIVAPDSFHSALKDYVAHKQSQLPTTLASLEQILKSTAGADDPERLKRYLFNEWKDHRLGYVLLVGDADVVPVRYMVLDRVTANAFNYAFYPSDLYYSDLAKSDGSFESWNAKKEGFHEDYFGEVRGEFNKDDPINYDQIDYLPDVAVGRWPVSTPDEVKIVAAKSIAYEKSLDDNQSAGRARAAFISIGGWVDARARLDQLAAAFPKSWTLEKRYFADAKRDDKTPPPNADQVVELLNSGVALMLHTGHGADDRWEQSFSVRDLKRVHNAGRLPIVMSAGCSTARFATLPPYEPYVDIAGVEHKGSDHGEVFTAPPPPPAPYQRGKYNPTGLGEQLLRHGPDGAVAYIGCNTGSQPCGLTLLDGFAKSFAHSAGVPPARLGDCWASAITYYYKTEHLADLKPNKDWYPPSIFFQGMKFMLFGDPTLKLPK